MERIDFYTPERMTEFWGYVQGLLETTSPGVMLWFSVVAVGMVLGIIVKAWKQGSKENNDDDDYDIHHY
jgi:hypothetical protein